MPPVPHPKGSGMAPVIETSKAEIHADMICGNISMDEPLHIQWTPTAAFYLMTDRTARLLDAKHKAPSSTVIISAPYPSANPKGGLRHKKYCKITKKIVSIAVFKKDLIGGEIQKGTLSCWLKVPFSVSNR